MIFLNYKYTSLFCILNDSSKYGIIVIIRILLIAWQALYTFFGKFPFWKIMTASKRTDKNSVVPALDKAFQILDCITASNHPMTSAEIAKALNIPRSSTHNILQKLTQKGVLYKDNNNYFYLGSYLLYWAGKFEQQQRAIQLFHELINQQPLLLLHTVTLSTIDWQKGDAVFLACHESPSPLGFVFRVGVRVPAIFSATGKAILSTCQLNEIQNMYPNGLPKPLTNYSVNSYEKLYQELTSVQNSRISLDNGQLREGMYCLGTYIRNASGKATAGIAVSFLENEYEQRREEVSQALIDLAIKIEQRLGFLN